MKFEPVINEALWFTMGDCCEGKHFLVGNPHTFPGRMGAWCSSKKVGFCVSKSEIQECSIEARYWIQGFLIGNEPDFPTDEEGDDLAEEHPKTQQWRAAIKQFPETGIWASGERICEDCGDEMLPTQPGLKCPQCSSINC